MKKLTLLIALSMVLSVANAQDLGISIFKTIDYYINDIETGEFGESIKGEIIIIIDLNKDIITFDTKEKHVFCIRSYGEKTESKNENNDVFYTTNFILYDKDGNQCGLDLRSYKEHNFHQIFLGYWDDKPISSTCYSARKIN